MAWVQKLEEKYQVRFFGHAAGQPKRPIVYFEQLNKQVLCVKVDLEEMVIHLDINYFCRDGKEDNGQKFLKELLKNKTQWSELGLSNPKYVFTVIPCRSNLHGIGADFRAVRLERNWHVALI